MKPPGGPPIGPPIGPPGPIGPPYGACWLIACSMAADRVFASIAIAAFARAAAASSALPPRPAALPPPTEHSGAPP